MGNVAMNREVIKLVVSVLVRVFIYGLAALGLGDLASQDAVKELISAFFTHLITAIFFALALWDIFRKPANREKIIFALSRIKQLFVASQPQQ